jgi:hypothetical protein
MSGFYSNPPKLLAVKLCIFSTPCGQWTLGNNKYETKMRKYWFYGQLTWVKSVSRVYLKLKKYIKTSLMTGGVASYNCKETFASKNG